MGVVHADSGKFQMQQFPDRHLAPAFAERNHHAVDFFSLDNCFDVRRSADKNQAARRHYGSAIVLRARGRDAAGS